MRFRPTALVALAAGIAAPSSAAADVTYWEGRVHRVDDGDTITVNLAGDSSSDRFKVRLTGIQAMELTSYGRRERVGECHAVEAARRLAELVRQGDHWVRLGALREDSVTGGRERLRRHVEVRIAGRWVDVAAVLLREGHGLWFPNRREWAWNREYSRLAAEAAAAGRGIWNTDACVPGPAASLGLKVKWDGGGTERPGFTREWVRITNTDPVNPVSLAGWWFRDSHLRRYRFRNDTTIPPGGSIKLLVGPGADSAGRLYWGMKNPVFENATAGRRALGDGGYLFDPDGDLRAWVQYPCRSGCGERLRSKLSIMARARYEHVVIRNVSAEPVSLEGYDLETSPWFYEFGSGEVLAPGKALVLWTGDSLFHISNDEDDAPSEPQPESPPEPGQPPSPEPEPEPPCLLVPALCPSTPTGASQAGEPSPPGAPPPAPPPQGDPPPQGPPPPPRGHGPRRSFDYPNVARVRSWGFGRNLLGNRSDAVTLRNAAGAPVVCHAWGRVDCPRV